MLLNFALTTSRKIPPSMGEMDADAVLQEAARESYETALELDPNNRAAKQGSERVNRQVQA